ncbi:hypothetical protein P175DRAFT_059203 [Aspergillus ochraceoroseus IBT 24754]|nr:uncharacterized protein P175DRAFT_059203 [Aspergillus ochraceoroseus IBT 24754]PTU25033.1 hypothetical protein P175DRAFT_059203 [Aspergillus ochraceoroseus IBT 24754]
MPMIYKRFTDKTAEEWRQIYKALQLLEFLVKNGSERVVDDARSHMSLLRMLRQFHFIDNNGKDQGINVRNRAAELVKLLGDVDMIRSERKKAKTNRNKFRGFEGGSGMSGGMGSGGIGGSGSRYGGFGSESLSFGGYSGGVYGDGGGFGGDTSEFQDTARRSNRFEEYDEYDEADAAPSRQHKSSPPRTQRETKQPEPAKAAAPDLVDFLDDDYTPSAPAPASTTSVAAGKLPVGGSNSLDMLQPAPVDDDDFDDFQSAPQAAPSSTFSIPAPASTVSTTSSTQFAAPRPVSVTQGSNLNGIVGFTSMPPTPTSSGVTSPTLSSQGSRPAAQPKPTGFQAATPNYFTSVSTMPSQALSGAAGHRPGMPSTSSLSSPTAAAPSLASKPAASKPSGDAFGSLWSSASASAGIQKTSTSTNKGPNLASMAKEKASASIWGTPAASNQSYQHQQQGAQTGSSGLDDLLG